MVRSLGASVVSPYSVDRVRTGAEPARVEAVSVGAAGEDAAVVSSRGRAIAFAVVSFASALTGVIGSPVAHAAGQHGASVSATVVKDTGSMPGARGMSSDTAAVRAQKDALVDRMLGRGRAGECVTDAMRRGVRDEMRVLPVDVLKVLDKNGTAVAVLCDTESIADVDVVKDVDLATRYSDAKALRAAAEKAMKAVEGRFAPRIQALEEELSGLGSAELEAEEMGGRRTEALMQLEERRDAAMAQAIDDATGGAVELYTPRGQAEDDQVVDLDSMLALINPTTVNELARLHGAKTPDEVARFTGLVRELNGARLTEAQARYAEESQEPLARDVDDRRFYAAEDRILIPAYHHEQGRVLSSHDVHSKDAWDHGGVLGQYWYQPGRNTVVVREEALGQYVLLHELGHAYEDAVQDLDGAAYRRFKSQRDAAYERLSEAPYDAFSEYALRSPPEMVAESFAVTFADDPAALREGDPDWARAFDGFIRDAGRISRR